MKPKKFDFGTHQACKQANSWVEIKRFNLAALTDFTNVSETNGSNSDQFLLVTFMFYVLCCWSFVQEKQSIKEISDLSEVLLLLLLFFVTLKKLFLWVCKCKTLKSFLSSSCLYQTVRMLLCVYVTVFLYLQLFLC